MSTARERFAENPFHVLALPVTATRAEVERAGQKWLAMLEVGVAAARIYATPVGPRVRTGELVRAAMAELRDPERRVVHELWCGGAEAESESEFESESESESESDPDPDLGFPALAALGWAR
jgi:hypothetical protein